MSIRSDRPPSPLGEHLTRFRERACLSRGEVAAAMLPLPVTEQAVGAWERGDRVPDRAHMKRLSEIYGLDDAAVAEAVRLATEPRPRLDEAQDPAA